jgi:hypothetical protein
VVLPDTPLSVALIVLVPTPTGLASPFESAALLIVATVRSDEDQVTADVRFCVELSEYVPVAVNCCVPPPGMLGVAGVMLIETSVAEVTVSVVLPDIPPSVALIVLVPTLTELASPFEPAALLIVATVSADEDQVTADVRSCVELSEYVPVAVSCWERPLAMLDVAGVTPIDTSVAEVTVSVVLPDIPLSAALIVLVPTPTELASPFEPAALLIVATVGADEDHVTTDVRFCVE